MSALRACEETLTAETAETAEKKILRILGELCVLCGKTSYLFTLSESGHYVGFCQGIGSNGFWPAGRC